MCFSTYTSTSTVSKDSKMYTVNKIDLEGQLNLSEFLTPIR